MCQEIQSKHCNCNCKGVLKAFKVGPVHLHGGLNVHSAHKPVLCDAQRDLDKGRILNLPRNLPFPQLRPQSILEETTIDVIY